VQEEDLVAELAQRVQVARVVDAASRVRHHDAQRVAQAAQLVLVLQVVAHEGVLGRDRLLEARIDLQPGGLPAEQHGNQRAQHTTSRLLNSARS
jgi:hypothetical protein